MSDGAFSTHSQRGYRPLSSSLHHVEDLKNALRGIRAPGNTAGRTNIHRKLKTSLVHRSRRRRRPGMITGEVLEVADFCEDVSATRQHLHFQLQGCLGAAVFLEECPALEILLLFMLAGCKEHGFRKHHTVDCARGVLSRKSSRLPAGGRNNVLQPVTPFVVYLIVEAAELGHQQLEGLLDPIRVALDERLERLQRIIEPLGFGEQSRAFRRRWSLRRCIRRLDHKPWALASPDVLVIWRKFHVFVREIVRRRRSSNRRHNFSGRCASRRRGDHDEQDQPVCHADISQANGVPRK
jgi:hypothetical protein